MTDRLSTFALTRAEWYPQAQAHRHKVEELTAAARLRKQRGEAHPVEDFMWTYYSQRPTQFLKWHPGFGVTLLDAPEYANERGYETVGNETAVAASFLRHRAESLTWILTLQSRVLEREPRFACFGLHEWAMVYRREQSEVRHEHAPLRLSPAEIAEVVEAQELKCTHYDAFRFYVPEARSLNHLMLQREDQTLNEQSGCLHANMDLYKWCYKSTPVVSSDLMHRAFLLARDIRTLDMQAAPYDLRTWGFEPVRVETAEGRAEYVRQQREFHERGQTLRAELIAQLSSALNLQALR
jgi:hypothetical protein